MSDQLAELKNTVKIQQTTISEQKECLRKKDSENEHLKSKIFDFTIVQNLRAQVKELQSENEHLKSKFVVCTMCQNLQVQVEKLKSKNEDLKLSVEKLTKAYEIVETTLREKDEMVFAQCEKIRLLEEQRKPFYECLLMVQKEYNDLLTSNDILKQRLETKFNFLKHDNSLEKMFVMIEQEYESNVSKISITSSTIETKNLELVKKMGDKVKRFDDEKKVFENKIAKMEKVLA
ncbi:hypothetical protein Tco_1101263 [Tanacetum coccineum]